MLATSSNSRREYLRERGRRDRYISEPGLSSRRSEFGESMMSDGVDTLVAPPPNTPSNSPNKGTNGMAEGNDGAASGPSGDLKHSLIVYFVNSFHALYHKWKGFRVF